MRANPAFAGVFVALAFLSHTASGEPQQSIGKELAYAFVSGCVQALPDLDRIEVGVKALDGTLVEGDAAKLLAPANPDAKWKTWLINRAPAPPFFMSTFRGVDADHSAVGCSVTNPYAPLAEVFPHIQKGLQLNNPPLQDETSGGQRSRLWRINVMNDQVVNILIVDEEPMGQPGLTMSATIFETSKEQ